MNGANLFTVGVLSLLVACGDAESDGGPGGGGGASLQSDAALSAQAAKYAGTQKANAKQYQSQTHQGNPMVNVYVNEVGAAEYAKIAPEVPVAFPEGTMIVKEMFGTDGMPMGLTVMYKQPAGYDPPNKDWWWGRLNVDGSPLQQNLVGKVALCNGCHQAAIDAAFGVPAAGK